MIDHPDNKVHGGNMGPIWGRQDPGGPHVGPMKLAIWALMKKRATTNKWNTKFEIVNLILALQNIISADPFNTFTDKVYVQTGHRWVDL